MADLVVTPPPNWFQTNKVLIFGLVAAVAMAVQQFATPPIDYLVLILAVVIASIGFLAKSLRGQWATILASLIPSFGVVFTQAQNHTPISLQMFFTSIAIAIAGVFSPPAKSASYEQSATIKDAKAEAKTIDDTKK